MLRCVNVLPGASARLRGIRAPCRSGAVTVYLASDSEALDEMSEGIQGRGWRVLSTKGPVAIPTWNNIALGAVGQHLGLVSPPASVQALGEDRVMAAWVKAAVDFFVFGLCDAILRPLHSTFSESAALLAAPKVDILGTFAQVCSMLQHAKQPRHSLAYAGVTGVDEATGLESCLHTPWPASSLKSLVVEWVQQSASAPDARGINPTKYHTRIWRARRRLLAFSRPRLAGRGG